MGRFIGKPWHDENGKEYAFVLAWGKVTRNAKIINYKKAKVDVGIAYKRKEFLNIEAWSDSLCFEFLAGLEAGDWLLILGTLTTDTYTNRDGEHKQRTVCKAEFAVCASLLQFIMKLFSSKTIQMILREEENAPPDPMESAEEYDDNFDPFAPENGEEADDIDIRI